MRVHKSFILMGMMALLSLQSCEQNEDILIPGNQQPDYRGVPTIKVENYVNRLFIDLLGREATDSERMRSVISLRSSNLSLNTRDSLIRRLQRDTQYRVGDSSYSHAWHERMYNLLKARFLEGADEAELYLRLGNAQFAQTIARLNGDSVGVFSAQEQINKYKNVLDSRWKYRKGLITLGEMCSFMINNGIYDQINMNSFNFVNASFDDLFRRFPVRDEFEQAYQVIEYNKPGTVFGRVCTNKNEYCRALTESVEFYEAQIRWAFYTLLQREAGTPEVLNLLSNYRYSGDFKNVQMAILRTDEYAQFK
ncbi:MAG: hypothetical protein KJS92_04405 [Bacteroidetes bacterium]|nr:hypothetical protein [Bacteroidota bacterium]